MSTNPGRRITSRTFQVFTRLDGAKVFASIQTPPLSRQGDSSIRRRIILQTANIVKVGDVLISPSGEKVILLAFPEYLAGYLSFQVAPVFNEYPWQRPIKVIDPAAKVLRDNGYANMGIVYASMDFVREDTLKGFVSPQYKFITGQDVKPDDIVGGMTVRTTYEMLGVRLVEVK